MNAYSFTFDAGGRVVPHPSYNRTGFRGESWNSLAPYQPLLQSFADVSEFRQFYQGHRGVYESQITCFRDSLDLEGMISWLDERFPESGNYDLYNIVFSPLVAHNQSSTWFESNGFRELQPHVNFPYAQDVRRLGPLSKAAELTYRGNIVFTELNHGYIGAVADRYAGEIKRAISNRSTWVHGSRGDSYYRGNAAFTEYMNWGLVTLRIMDRVPNDEQEELIRQVERMMVRNRGFAAFEAFNAFLMDSYRERPPGVTLADMFPEIIAWFDRHN
jgi:hypothetical protein